MTFFNCELQKYYWKTCSWSRLLGVPAIFLSITVFFEIMDVPNTDAFIAATAANIFYLFVFFLGSYVAAGAVIDEVRNSTWYLLRMSSMSPLQVSIGKLFGPTLYMWYVGCIALLLFVFYGARVYEFHFVVYQVILMVATGIFCHSMVLIFCFARFDANKKAQNPHKMLPVLLGLLAAWVFHELGDMDLRLQYENIWFGIPAPSSSWKILFLLSCLIWSCIGVYRLLCRALQCRIIPWVWGSFVLFQMAFAAGFYMEENVHFQWPAVQAPFEKFSSLLVFFTQSPLCIAFSVSVACAYTILFYEKLNVSQYRDLLSHYHSRQTRFLLEKLPAWSISLGISSLFGLFFYHCCTSHRGSWFDPSFRTEHLAVFTPRYFDLSLLFVFCEGEKQLSATLFVLSLLYFIIPALLFYLDSLPVHWFYPTFISGDWWQLIGVIVQVILVSGLVVNRYKTCMRRTA